MLTRIFIIAIASVILAFNAAGMAPAASSAQETDTESVYTAWGEAFAAGDIGTHMSYWADDGVITDIGVRSTLIVGKPAIAMLTSFPVVTSLTTEQLTMDVEGDQVITTEEWSDEVSDAAGVDRYIVETTVTVEDGKVARFDIRYDETDDQTSTYFDYLLTTPSVPFPGSLEFPLAGEQQATGFVAALDDVSFIEVHASAAASAAPWTAEISGGSCASAGAIVAPLADVRNGVSFTMLSTPLSTFEVASAIHLNDQNGEVSCGAIPSRTAPTPATPVPSAPSPTPGQGVVAPDAGSGAVASSGDRGLSLLVAVAMATAGLAVVLGIASRRARAR